MENNENNYKNIDPVKTGNFIKELRLSHNWTQEELGDKIFISRKSVSKWETGKCCPSIDMLKRLSETLGVSFDDLIAGEFVNPVEETKDTKRLIINNKKFRITWKIVLSLAFILLLLFFVYNYNTTKVYKIGYKDSNFILDNGVIVISNAKNYINLGDFYANFSDISDNTTFMLSLYTINQGKMVVILDQDTSKTPHSSKDIPNEFLTTIFKDYVEDLYLKVEFVNIYGETKVYDLKLDVEIDFMNNFIYTLNICEYLKTSTTEENSNISGNPNLPKDNNNDETKIIDISFLYEIEEETLIKVLNGTFVIDSRTYVVSYEEGTLKVCGEDRDIMFMKLMNKVIIKDSSEIVINIDKSYTIELYNENEEYSELLSKIIHALEEKL